MSRRSDRAKRSLRTGRAMNPFANAERMLEMAMPDVMLCVPEAIAMGRSAVIFVADPKAPIVTGRQDTETDAKLRRLVGFAGDKPLVGVFPAKVILKMFEPIAELAPVQEIASSLSGARRDGTIPIVFTHGQSIGMTAIDPASRAAEAGAIDSDNDGRDGLELEDFIESMLDAPAREIPSPIRALILRVQARAKEMIAADNAARVIHRPRVEVVIAGFGGAELHRAWAAGNIAFGDHLARVLASALS